MAAIKAKMTADVDGLVQRFFPNARKTKQEWVLGGLDGSKGTRLCIRRTGHKAGWWKNFASGEGGDIITLVAHARRDGDIGGAIRWARDYYNLGETDQNEVARINREAQETAERQARQDALDQIKIQKAALYHYLQGVPIRGTMAETYLTGRGIDFRWLGRYPNCLRFHAAMRCPVSGRERPAMLASLHNGAGDLVSFQRYFLMAHADGSVTTASTAKGGDLEKAKLAYSAYAGAWVPLWRGASGKPLRQHPEDHDIGTCEGVEDGLSIAMVRPELRMLPTLSLSNLGNLVLPAHKDLYVCADNDTHPDAIAGFDSSWKRLAARGYNLIETRPPPEHKDFNDWLMAIRPRQQAVA